MVYSKNNNKRLLINTLILYGRMFICMGCSFFSVRIMLKALGVSDYGMICAIESVAALWGALSGGLSTAAARFFTFELGKNNLDQLKNIFSMICTIYCSVIIIIFILMETVGLWYLKKYLVIPAGQQESANVFYQIVVCISLLNLAKSPYSSLLIAYENMRIYSFLCIFDNLMKLAIAITISFYSGNKLICYGWFFLLVNVANVFFHWIYCYKNYLVSHFKFVFSKNDFKKLFSFMSWSTFGFIAWSSSDVFLNLLLNRFFGPVINATRGIASQVDNAVSLFTVNFLTASRPQIVKAWVSENKNDFLLLLERISKIGFFLLIIIIIPVFYEINCLLVLWLKEIPDYAVVFIRLILLTSIINFFNYPIVYAMQATGKIAVFEVLGSGIRLLILPISWGFFAYGAPPQTAFIVSLFMTLLCCISRLIIFCRRTNISIIFFIRHITIPSIKVLVCAQVVPIFIIFSFSPSIYRLFFMCFFSGIWTFLCWFFLGITYSERSFCVKIIKTKCIPLFLKKGNM